MPVTYTVGSPDLTITTKRLELQKGFHVTCTTHVCSIFQRQKIKEKAHRLSGRATEGFSVLIPPQFPQETVGNSYHDATYTYSAGVDWSCDSEALAPGRDLEKLGLRVLRPTVGNSVGQTTLNSCGFN